MDEQSLRERIGEPSRNLELHRLGLLDDAKEESYDRLTRLVGRLLDVPIARLSVVEPERQFFKSETNRDDPEPDMRETPLSHAFCKFVVAGDKPLIISDAAADPRFADHPAFTEHGARAYAGFPVHSPAGNVLASFCVVDNEAHEWTKEELSTLETLTDIVVDEIKLRALTIDIAEQQKQQTSLLDAIAEGVIGLDQHGDCIFANPSARDILGWHPGQFEGTPVHDLLHPQNESIASCDADTCPLNQAIQRSHHLQLPDTTIWQMDGEPIPVDLSISPVRTEDGSSGGVIVFSDIRERKAAEKARAEAEFRLRTLFENIPAITFIAEPDDPGQFLYISPQIVQMLGYSPDEWRADPSIAFAVIHPDDRERIRQEFQQAAETGEEASLEYRLTSRIEATIWVRNSIKLVRDESGHPIFWLGIAVDISEQKRLEQRLIRQAYIDPVTRLPNRSWFTERLRTITKHGISSSHNTFAVIFFDLDNFKVVNDSLGHSAGDAVLWHVAHRVASTVNGTATVARLGGDEFTVLIEHVSDIRAVRQLAEEVLATLHEPIQIDGQPIVVSASAGIAIGQPNALIDPEDIIKSADLAMYEAKRNGKGTIAEFAPHMSVSIWERMNIEVSLRQALQRNEFAVYYQPIIDLTTGAVVDTEALIRWLHPDRGMVSPAEFIPVAEQSGLILRIGRWVLETAVEQVAHWRESANMPNLKLSVNVSSLEYVQTGFVESVTAILQRYGFPPADLTLEITERYGLDSSTSTMETLHQLRHMGVSLSIDDFGTGFSSLQYLKRFPVNAIKIDRSFVRDITVDTRDHAIVDAIMAVAHTLNMTVTAEGIEDDEQFALLRDLGCHRGQGFRFAAALPAGEMEQYMIAGSVDAINQL